MLHFDQKIRQSLKLLQEIQHEKGLNKQIKQIIIIENSMIINYDTHFHNILAIYTNIYIYLFFIIIINSYNSMILIILLLQLLLREASAGKILNQYKKGLQAFRANLNSYTSFTFEINIPTTLYQTSELVIQYPNNYDTNNIALTSDEFSSTSCPVSFATVTSQICPSFTVNSNHQLILVLQGTTLAGEYTIIVYNNLNPMTSSSNEEQFSIWTISQGIIIDSNSLFSDFLFAQTFATSTSSYNLSINNIVVNSITNVTFLFTVTQDGLYWLRIRIPSQFTNLVNILCGINNNFLNYTLTQTHWIKISQQQFLTKQSYTFQIYNLLLPQFAVTSQPFILQILQNNTFTVIQRITYSGLTVAEGTINQITVLSDNFNSNGLANYSLIFFLDHQIKSGLITIKFNNTFVLATNCTSSFTNISCYSSGNNFILEPLSLYAKQLISVQFQVINPSDSTLQYALQINTYTLFNDSIFPVDYLTIPFNLTSILTPIFQAFEMYTPIINATLNQNTAIDFRVVPKLGNQLPLSSVTGSKLSQVYFQLPLWFRVNGQQYNDLGDNFFYFAPNCTFGSEGAYSCSYRYQTFILNTPVQQIDSKYPENIGLGDCDKPMSVKNVIMPPIPGRFDFRLLTFINSKAYINPPTEQDLFTMQIPVNPFPAISLTASSNQASDPLNILKLVLTIDIGVPREGVINLNFSLNSSSTVSAWVNRLGYDFSNATTSVSGNLFIQIPCGAYINNNLQTNSQCYLFDVSSNGYNIIQWMNFGSLNSGDQVILYLMNITYCIQSGKSCQLSISSAYTINLYNPYYLNVQSITINQHILPATAYQNINNIIDMTMASSISTTLCNSATWEFSLTPSLSPITSDFLVFTFNYSYIYTTYYKYISSPNGTVGLILDPSTMNLIVIISLNSNSAGTIKIFLNSFTNPYQQNSFLSPVLNFWSQKQKSAIYSFAKTYFTGDGIFNAAIQVIPTNFQNLARSFADADLYSNITLQLNFTTCNPIPANGAIKIVLPAGIKYYQSCNIYSGLIGKPYGLSSTINCVLVNSSYIITGFLRTNSMSNIIVIIEIYINTSFILSNIEIFSYSDTTLQASSIIDSNLNLLGSNSYSFGSTGYTFPKLLSFDDFVIKNQNAVMNQRGQFYFILTPTFTHSFPEFILFDFSNIASNSIEATARLHCRINGTLADSCIFNTNTVKFTLPIGFTIQIGLSYIVSISTRGRDNSLTSYEGLTLLNAGYYSMKIQTDSTLSTYEYTAISVEVLPPTFNNFWVYSLSKNVKTGINLEDGLTTYMIFFDCYLPGNSTLTVQFFRSYAGTDGFEQDLGTGIPNGGNIPCYVSFLNSPTCTLYYGSYPNPTTITISNIAGLNYGSYSIHIPNIYNPNISLSVVNVGLLAYQSFSNGEIQNLYQSQYPYVNVTYGLPSFLISQITYQNLSYHPTFVCSNLSTNCLLNIQIATGTYHNTGSDYVVFQFPNEYPLIDGYYECNFPFCANCCLAYSQSSMIIANLYYWWNVPTNSIITGTINMSTPLYSSLSGNNPITIKTYLYYASKLQKITYMNITQSFTPIQLTLLVTADNTNIAQFANYKIAITIPVAIPSTAIILVKIPMQLTNIDGTCEITTSTDAYITTSTFICDNYQSNPNQLLIQNFGGFSKNQVIQINTRILNPSTIISISSWTIQIFYIFETPLDKLMASGSGNSVTLTNTVTLTQYWDQQFTPTTEILSGNRGSLVLQINEIQSAGGISNITFTTGFITLPLNVQISCMVTMNIYPQTVYQTSPITNTVPLSCLFSPGLITITTQLNPYLSCTTGSSCSTKLIINTLNDNNGLLFSGSGATSIIVTAFNGFKKSCSIFIATSNFQSFTSTTLITNPGKLTLITISFTPSKNADSFQMKFPIVDQQNNSKPIYSGDLGTGFTNGGFMSCFSRSGFGTPGPIDCSLNIGTIGADLFTSIRFDTNIKQGISYTIQIDGIMTPFITGNDYTHVYHTLESYNGSNLLDRSSVYDYTVRNNAYSNQAINFQPIRSTDIINDTGLSIQLQLRNYLSYNPSTSVNTYIIIQFPENYYNPIPQTINYGIGTTAWVSSGNNWVIYTPNSTLAANSSINIVLYECTNSFLVSSNIVLRAYYVSNRVIMRSYTYNPMTPLSVTSGTTYIAPILPIPTTSCNIHSYTVTAANDGIGIQLLQINLKVDSINNSFALNFVINTPTFTISNIYTAPNSSFILTSLNNYIFSFNQSLGSNTIIVYLSGTQSDNSVDISGTLYNQNFLELSNFFFTYTSANIHTLDTLVRITSKRNQAMKSQAAAVRLTVNMTSAMTRGDYFSLNTTTWGSYFTFPSTFTNCFLNNLASESITIIGGVLKIFAPILGLGKQIVTIKFLPALTLGSATSNLIISRYKNTGALVQSYTKTLIPNNLRLSSSSSTNLHFVSTTNSQYSIFKASLNLLQTISTTNILKIYFNTYSNSLGTNLFDPNLGRFQNLQTTDCIGTVLSSCVVQIGAKYSQAPTIISLQPLTSISGEFSFSIPKITIPQNISAFLSVSMLLVSQLGQNISQLASEYILYPTITPTNLNPSNIKTIVPSPNLVGSPSNLVLTINSYTGYSYDTIVLEYDSALLINQPFTPSNPSLSTSVTKGNIILYPITNWIQITLNYTISGGGIVNINNLKNVGWQSPLSILLYQMISNSYSTSTLLSTTPQPNIPALTQSANPFPILISQFETFTLTLSPINIIYAGGSIYIYLPNIGMNGSPYCRIRTGIANSNCIINWYISPPTLIISGFRTYYPVIVDQFNYANNILNPIRIQFDASMPNSYTGALAFSINIYNDSSLTTINEQLISSSILSVQYANILGVNMQQIVLSPQLLAANQYGSISLNLQLSQTLSFATSDYLAIDFGDAITSRYLSLGNYYYQYGYLMCLFQIAGTNIKNIKTHRCEFTNWTILTIYIPEQLNMTSNNVYKVTIMDVLMNSSNLYWINFRYVKNGNWGPQRGWMQFTINPSLFQSQTIDLLTYEATGDIINSPTFNVMNLTLQSNNAIPDSTGPLQSRIVLTFYTHNEQNITFPTSLVYNQINYTQQIGCNGAYAGTTRPLPSFFSNGISCNAIQAAGNSWNNTPAYVIIEGYKAIPASEIFNIAVGRFLNPLIPNTFIDIDLMIQTRLITGDWISLNQNIIYNLIPNVYQPPHPATSGSGAYQSPQYTHVNDNFGTYSIGVSPGINLIPGDNIMFSYSYPYITPARSICSQYVPTTITNYTEGCVTIPFQNIFILTNNYPISTSESWQSLQFDSFKNPAFTYNESGAASKVYISIYSQQKLLYNYSFATKSPYKRSSYVVMESTTSNNPVNNDITQQAYYRVGVNFQSVTSSLHFIQLLAPSVFTIKRCQVNRGLKQISPFNPINCTFYRNSSGWSIQLSNFDNYGYQDGLVILDLYVLNPAAAGWTPQWKVSSYLQMQNFNNKITENYNANGVTWVGQASTPPLYFQVYRNTKSFQDRIATINQYSQLWARIIPRSNHTTSAKYLIQMPITYDLPNSLQTQCNSTYTYHNIYNSPNCTINPNRSVTEQMKLPTIEGQCQIITSTSLNSIDGNNGFLLPPNITGQQKFDLTIFDNSVIQNVQSIVSPKPYPLTSITLDTTIRQVNYPNSIVRIKFTTNTPVPAGYYSNIPIGYRGRIAVMFLTRQISYNATNVNGFPIKLGYSSTQVPCKVIRGLLGRTTCTLQPALFQSIFQYAQIIISDFSSIQNQTQIQIHLLNLQYATSIYSLGVVGVTVYQIDQNNNTISLSYQTFASNPTTITYSSNIYQSYYIQNYLQTVTGSMLPNFVGVLSTLTISFTTSVTLSQNDILELTFPTQYLILDNSVMTANTSGYQFTVIVYQNINKVLLIIPSGEILPAGNCWININNIINAAFAFTYTTNILLNVIQSNSRVHIITVNMIGPQPSPFSECILQLSNYQSAAVAVNYTFNFIPSYIITKNSILTVIFPNSATLNYSTLSKANPPEVCTSDVGICTLSPNLLTLNINLTLNDFTQEHSILITGVKNPTGVIPPKTFLVQISTLVNHVSYLVHKQYLQNFMFYPSTGANNLYISLYSSSYFQNVTADFQLIVQTSTYMPPQSSIILFLPQNWNTNPIIQSIQGDWNFNTLLYTTTISSNSTYTTYSISTLFYAPAKSTITINFLPFSNPSVNFTDQFSAQTIYDSVILDQSKDYITLSYQTIPPILIVTNYTYEPSTEFYASSYIITFTLGMNKITRGSSIVFYFSDGFQSGLTNLLPLSAHINLQEVQNSIENLKLTLTTIQDLDAYANFSIQLNGIINPSVGSYFINVAIISSQGSVLQFSNNFIQISTIISPTNIFLTYMDTSSYECSDYSTYKFCLKFPSDIIGINMTTYIDFPVEYDQVLPSSCQVNELVANFSVVTDLNRIKILNLQTNSSKVCYKLTGVQNPASVGETHPIILSLVNSSNQKLLYKTYPNLNSFNTITFLSTKLKIKVSSIQNFSQFTCSYPITISLARPVSYNILLIPALANFLFLPASILFLPSDSEHTFIIIPTNLSKFGTNYITWTKVENSSINVFEQIQATTFNYLVQPYLPYQIMLSSVLSITPINKTSNNISITLTIAPSSNMQIAISYSNKPQCINLPSKLIFMPGIITQQNFNYSSFQCGLSGYINLSIATSNYSSIYYLYATSITVQLTQPDLIVPSIINHYVYDLGQNYITYRIMSSEPVTVYYMLTLRGTKKPPSDQLVNNSLRKIRLTKTAVIQLYGSNTSVSTLHSKYTSYDTYLYIKNLNDTTNYLLYFIALDLSGNPSIVLSRNIQTFKHYYPAITSLCLTQSIPIPTVLNILVQASNVNASNFIITSLSGYIYQIVLAPFPLGDRPIQIMQQLDQDILFIKNNLPLCNGFNFTTNTYENISFKNQWINYGVSYVDDSSISVWVVVQQNGYLYASVGGWYPEQVKYGLSSDNFPIYNTWFGSHYAFQGENNTITLTQLYGETNYAIYLVAQNDATVIDLMSDSQVLNLTALTSRSVYSIPKSYVWETFTGSTLLLLLILDLLLLI